MTPSPGTVAEPPVERAQLSVASVSPREGNRLAAAARGGALAMLDQAIVSGTNFLTIVLVGRSCSDYDLGLYSLGFTVMVLLTCVQESLVTAPYTVYREQTDAHDRAAYAGSVLFQQLAIAVLAAIGLVFVSLTVGGDATAVGCAVAGAVPLVLLRDFCRRYAFSHGRFGSAFLLDLAVAAGQVGLLLWLGSRGTLTAVTAFGAVALACGLAGVAFLFRNWGSFKFYRDRFGPEIGRHWTFGRWVAAGQMIGVIHGFAVHWLLAVLLGPAATGTFAACLAVATLSNPFFLGASNLLGPRAARAWADGGRAEVRRVITAAALMMTGVMGAFCAVVAVAGELILHLLYRGEYSGQGFTLTALAVALVVVGPGMAADHGLRALGRPRSAFVGSLVGLAVTAVASTVLTLWWGVPGAACGYVAGSWASAAVRLIAFFRLSSLTTEEV